MLGVALSSSSLTCSAFVRRAQAPTPIIVRYKWAFANLFCCSIKPGKREILLSHCEASVLHISDTQDESAEKMFFPSIRYSTTCHSRALTSQRSSIEAEAVTQAIRLIARNMGNDDLGAEWCFENLIAFRSNNWPIAAAKRPISPLSMLIFPITSARGVCGCCTAAIDGIFNIAFHVH